MREAIGATWIMGIVLTFIALFSGYLAFSVNQAKAYKVKDAIIDRIEKYKGLNTSSIEEINNYMNEIGYSSDGTCDAFLEDTDLESRGVLKGVKKDQAAMKITKGSKYSYCVQKVNGSSTDGQVSSAYYKVTVFFTLSLPIVNNSSIFQVTGETINIDHPKDVF